MNESVKTMPLSFPYAASHCRVHSWWIMERLSIEQNKGKRGMGKSLKPKLTRCLQLIRKLAESSIWNLEMAWCCSLADDGGRGNQWQEPMRGTGERLLESGFDWMLRVSFKKWTSEFSKVAIDEARRMAFISWLTSVSGRSTSSVQRPIIISSPSISGEIKGLHQKS
ncbi:hypothetical protein TNCV_5065891 [Trichonephila clavipes]|nr:hypothetical protein TNCV_5065891 [Trichonephila clavipes]